jgi:hypothetical protein
MQKFIFKFALFLGIIFTIDHALSRLLDLGRPADYAAFVDSKSEYDNLAQVDILFLGDSQTADGFVPSVFKEKLGATAFNYGVYQLSPFEGYFLLKDLVSRRDQPPKLVVLGTDAQMFHYPVSDGKYSPLFIKNPLNLLSLFYKSSYLGAITATGRKKYLFAGLAKRLTTAGAGAEMRREVQRIENGYLLNEKHYTDDSQFDCNKDRGFFSVALIEKQKEYFHKTLAYLHAQNIPVVIANLPMHKNFLAGMRAKPAYHEFNAVIAEIEFGHGVAVFNRNHELLADELADNEFLDGDHLCYSGAKKFSAQFADYLLEAGFSFNEFPNTSTDGIAQNFQKIKPER